jgi:hypothetical protein
MDRNAAELTGTLLCHMHTPSWEAFHAAYKFRLAQGSYRSELKPVPTADGAGVNMNALFAMIEQDGGLSALRTFYDEVCTATPALRERLLAYNLLHEFALELDDKRARHFSDLA